MWQKGSLSKNVPNITSSVNTFETNNDGNNSEDQYSVLSLSSKNKIVDWIETNVLVDYLKFDTGAQCNIITKNIAQKCKLNIKQYSSKFLITYNNTSIPVIREYLQKLLLKKFFNKYSNTRQVYSC